MTTLTWNTPSSASNKAEYGSIASELHTKLIGAGLTAGTDTGQIDFGAMSGTITDGQNYGFKIYKMSDAGLFDIFLKIEFCTGTNSASSSYGQFKLLVSIGLGTNGSGTLTSGTTPVTIGVSNATRITGSPNQVSSICLTGGFLGVVWKERYFDSSTSYAPSGGKGVLASFFICRDTDESGGLLGTGASLVLIGSGGIGTSMTGQAPRCIRLSSAGIVTDSSMVALAVGSDAVTSVGGSAPVYNIFTMTPSPKRLAQLGCIPISSMSDRDTVSLALKGTVSKTYIATTNVWPGDMGTGAQTKSCIVSLWE